MVQPVVLVVEDDEAIREIVSRMLESEGYTVHAASNGLEGMERFYVTLPELIILDVKMPQMDGWETLGRVRQISNCPVIMLTVLAAQDDIEKALQTGADDYMAKPFGIRELKARVEAVLRRSSLV